MNKRAWSKKNLKDKTKILVYRAVVLTTLLRGLETWVTYPCVRTILNICWSDFVTHFEILEQAKIASIDAMPLKYHLLWAEHVSKMVEHRLQKIDLYGELSIGYKDCHEMSLAAYHA